jgi:putative ABC transport system substrate-binding protein
MKSTAGITTPYTWRLGSALLMLVFVLQGFYCAAAAAKVNVVLSRSAGSYTASMDGFRQAAGFEFEQVNMEGDSSRGREIMAGFAPAGTHLVVAVGTEAMLAAKALNPSIPLLYTMVLEPAAISGHQISSIVLKIDPSEQFARLHKMLPGCKRIGVIYNPSNSSQDVNQARAAAVKFGMALNPIAIEKVEDLDNALSKLTKDSVDLLWMVVDPNLVNPTAIEKMVRHSLDQGIPLVGLSSFHVKAGAWAAFSVDFSDIGAQTADLAQEMLKGGMKNRVTGPRKIIFYVNAKTQKAIGLTVVDSPEMQYVQ